MKKCCVCFIEKELSMFHMDRTKRDGHSSTCKLCASNRLKKYYKVHSEKIKERSAEWYKNNFARALLASTEYAKKNRLKVNAIYRKWYSLNKEKAAASVKKWTLKNKARLAATRAKWTLENAERIAAKNSQWSRNNPGKRMAVKAARRAREKFATPAWANNFFIEEIYDLAARRTRLTGFKWHVDHMVPMQSKTVCGLHVENNLRVIPAKQNQSKNNRWWPDMPQGA